MKSIKRSVQILDEFGNPMPLPKRRHRRFPLGRVCRALHRGLPTVASYVTVGTLVFAVLGRTLTVPSGRDPEPHHAVAAAEDPDAPKKFEVQYAYFDEQGNHRVSAQRPPGVEFPYGQVRIGILIHLSYRPSDGNYIS